MPPRRPEPTPAPDALRADGVPLLYDVPGRRPQPEPPPPPDEPEPPAPEKETD